MSRSPGACFDRLLSGRDHVGPGLPDRNRLQWAEIGPRLSVPPLEKLKVDAKTRCNKEIKNAPGCSPRIAQLQIAS